MPKPLELRKVKRILKKYGIIYVAGKGRHPKFYDPTPFISTSLIHNFALTPKIC